MVAAVDQKEEYSNVMLVCQPCTLSFSINLNIYYYCAKRPVVGARKLGFLPAPSQLPDSNYFYRAANALRYASAAHGVFELLICKRISKVEKKTRLKRISG